MNNTNNITIIKKRQFCMVPREPFEIYERYMTRSYVIVDQYPKTQSEYENAIRLSRYFDNIRYLNCVYDINIHNAYDQYKKYLV